MSGRSKINEYSLFIDERALCDVTSKKSREAFHHWRWSHAVAMQENSAADVVRWSKTLLRALAAS